MENALSRKLLPTQALKWIRQREQSHGLVIKTFTDDYLRHLELAIQYGKPFLIESVETDMDPALNPVLEKALVLQDGQKVVLLCKGSLCNTAISFFG